MSAPDAPSAHDGLAASDSLAAATSGGGRRGRDRWSQRSWWHRIAVLGAAALVGTLAGKVYLVDDGTDSAQVRAAIELSTGITRYPVSDRGVPVVVSGESLTGELLSTEGLRGDVVVLNVWGSWCPPCREEAPVLAETSQRLADRGVSFLGINVRDNTAAALAFEESFGINYPSIADVDGQALLSLNRYVPANAVPVTLVLDRQGRVASRIVGVLTATSLASALDPVMNETGKD